MKKVFEDDSSYMEVLPSPKNQTKLVVTLCARNAEKSQNVTMVSVEIDKNEFKNLFKEFIEDANVPTVS